MVKTERKKFVRPQEVELPASTTLAADEEFADVDELVNTYVNISETEQELPRLPSVVGDDREVAYNTRYKGQRRVPTTETN